MPKAKINDVFVSIQGEGKYISEPQCFIRFYGCNLNCGFCDTKISDFKQYSCEELLDELKRVISGRDIKTVSLTGGEPLLERDFLLDFLPMLKRRGFKVYLETNGVLHNEFFDVMDNVDVIAMDIKLPSSTGQKGFWREHEEFLKAAANKDVFVKIIVCINTTLDDLKQAIKLVSGINPKLTIVLQPNSQQLGAELAAKLHEFKKYCRQHLSDVRSIPQLHKAIGVK
ncbi:MAG: 7-carboxy-7-deazaguanine synthase QueE [Candidatus Omnitrophica bacterium]|nr:7-carboxy-7-deazaguanine synthase QueE [Candidatus Omnitrophota bacterium]MDD5355865.1 7-carboxy-7-deazaguanine synthase QueE [Candidatus Omnitrophota bacterium]